MAEKWQRSENRFGVLEHWWDERIEGPTRSFVVRDDEADDLLAVLNALEADKAALLDALEFYMRGHPCSGGSGCPGWDKAHDLLSRIQSEGAEVKAGE